MRAHRRIARRSGAVVNVGLRWARGGLHPAGGDAKTRAVRRSFAGSGPIPASICAVSMAALVLSFAAVAHADDMVAEDRPGEVPSRPEKRESAYKPPPSVRLPTIVGGLAFTAGFWGAGAGTAYLFPDAPSISYLNRPVIGPWQAVYHHGCGGSCEWTDYLATVWYVFDGLAQAGGIGIALQGLLIPTASYGAGGSPPPSAPAPRSPGPRRDDDAPPPASAPAGTPAPAPGPLFYLPRPIPIGHGGLGLGLGGTF